MGIIGNLTSKTGIFGHVRNLKLIINVTLVIWRNRPNPKNDLLLLLRAKNFTDQMPFFDAFLFLLKTLHLLPEYLPL